MKVPDIPRILPVCGVEGHNTMLNIPDSMLDTPEYVSAAIFLRLGKELISL